MKPSDVSAELNDVYRRGDVPRAIRVNAATWRRMLASVLGEGEAARNEAKGFVGNTIFGIPVVTDKTLLDDAFEIESNGDDMSGETDQQRAYRKAAPPIYASQLPASVGGTVKKRCVTDPEFAEQVRAMWDAMPTDPGRSFLAGVRIAQGYVEFGSDVFAKELADLEFEAAQEEADALIYSTVRTLPQPIRDALANPNRVAG